MNDKTADHHLPTELPGAEGYNYSLPDFKAGSRLLLQGDSITDMQWGRNQADRNHYLGHSYVYLIAARLGVDMPGAQVDVFNRGMSGHTVADLRTRWQNDAIDMKPDLLSVLIGTNDVAQLDQGGECAMAAGMKSAEHVQPDIGRYSTTRGDRAPCSDGARRHSPGSACRRRLSRHQGEVWEMTATTTSGSSRSPTASADRGTGLNGSRRRIRRADRSADPPRVNVRLRPALGVQDEDEWTDHS